MVISSCTTMMDEKRQRLLERKERLRKKSAAVMASKNEALSLELPLSGETTTNADGTEQQQRRTSQAMAGRSRRKDSSAWSVGSMDSSARTMTPRSAPTTPISPTTPLIVDGRDITDDIISMDRQGFTDYLASLPDSIDKAKLRRERRRLHNKISQQRTRLKSAALARELQSRKEKLQKQIHDVRAQLMMFVESSVKTAKGVSGDRSIDHTSGTKSDTPIAPAMTCAVNDKAAPIDCRGDAERGTRSSPSDKPAGMFASSEGEGSGTQSCSAGNSGRNSATSSSSHESSRSVGDAEDKTGKVGLGQASHRLLAVGVDSVLT